MPNAKRPLGSLAEWPLRPPAILAKESLLSWMSERWGAFSAAAGPRRYVIGAIVSVVIAFSDHIWSWFGNASMTGLLGVPSWAMAIIIALCMIAYWLLEHLVHLRRRIRGARYELAQLRSRGVAIRNEGRSITNRQKLEDWGKSSLDWNEEVIASIKKINEADAEWFSVLDVVPDPRLPIEHTSTVDLKMSADHHKLYREHDLRLKRLGEMLYEIWDR